MKVFEVAELSEGKIYVTAKKPGDFAATVTSLEQVSESSPECSWQMEINVDRGPGGRRVFLDLGRLMSKGDYQKSQQQPIFISVHREDSSLLLFRDKFFMTDRPAGTSREIEEASLRVKKMVYDSEKEILSLKEQITNIEAAVEYSHSKTAREPIANDVKLLVWARDQGRCVNCGSKENLQFDHIIPVSKGGSNSKENIQILCQACNVKKSDKISL